MNRPAAPRTEVGWHALQASIDDPLLSHSILGDGKFKQDVIIIEI
jgi:hypothetical protein